MVITTVPQHQPPVYPLPAPSDGPRFTYGLLFDIAGVLARHGYPPPAGTDWAGLMGALSRFIYQERRTA